MCASTRGRRACGWTCNSNRSGASKCAITDVVFTPGDGKLDETHVGMRIMAERAERIGGTLEVFSTPSHGSSVVLTLPAEARALYLRLPQGRATLPTENGAGPIRKPA